MNIIYIWKTIRDGTFLCSLYKKSMQVKSQGARTLTLVMTTEMDKQGEKAGRRE